MTLANQYREFVTPLLIKAFANVNGTNLLRMANTQFFADKLLKNDHLPICKVLYKKKPCIAQLAGARTV
jgi:hypothetical protein